MEKERLDTKELRSLMKMTQKEFSDRYDIPLRTVQNWDQRKCMPGYVYGLIYMTMYYEERLNDQSNEIRKLRGMLKKS